MISNDRVIAELAEANPVPRTAAHGPAERADAERILHRVLSSPPSTRRQRTILAPAVSVLSVLVVLAVAGLFLGIRGSSRSGGPARGGVRIVFQAHPTPQTPEVTPRALSRELHLMRERLGSIFHDFRVTQLGNNRVVVVVHDAAADDRARILALLTAPGLLFYDWEANALTPNGKPVASQLQAQDKQALALSQGGSTGPGNAGGASMLLYPAARLASRQPLEKASDNSRLGSQYYMFGAPGSAACATLAKDNNAKPTPGIHCLLSGPDDNHHDLVLGLPAGISAAECEQLVIRQGTVVLQAADANASLQTNFSNPEAQFYVLKDHVALFGNDITNPQQSTSAAGNPDVRFGFTEKGKSEFQRVTAAIAKRGALVSSVGQTLNQHFAVALENKLIAVPSIDFKTYPDGIDGSTGADINSGRTTQSARSLATQLRYGAQPVRLSVR